MFLRCPGWRWKRMRWLAGWALVVLQNQMNYGSLKGTIGPTLTGEEGYQRSHVPSGGGGLHLSRLDLRVAQKQLKKGGSVMTIDFHPMFIVMNIFCKMLKGIGRRFLLRAGSFWWDSGGIIPWSWIVSCSKIPIGMTAKMWGKLPWVTASTPPQLRWSWGRSWKRWGSSRAARHLSSWWTAWSLKTMRKNLWKWTMVRVNPVVLVPHFQNKV